MILFPRFRYILATPSVERGSAILDLELRSSHRGEEVWVRPARLLVQAEFDAYSAGLVRFHREILRRGAAEAELIEHATVHYQVGFSPPEMYSRLLHDEEFWQRMLALRRSAAEKSAEVVRDIYASLATPSPDTKELVRRWHSVTQEFFSTSIPLLVADEAILRSFERFLAAKARDTLQWWRWISFAYQSPYLGAALKKHAAVCWQEKEWVGDTPALAERLEVATPSFCGRLENEIDAQSDPHDAAIVRRAPLVFHYSEETHHILGALNRAANRLWRRICGAPCPAEWPGVYELLGRKA